MKLATGLFPNSINYCINSLKMDQMPVEMAMIGHKLLCLPNPAFSVSSTAGIVFKMGCALYASCTMAIPGAYEDKGD